MLQNILTLFNFVDIHICLILLLNFFIIFLLFIKLNAIIHKFNINKHTNYFFLLFCPIDLEDFGINHPDWLINFKDINFFNLSSTQSYLYIVIVLYFFLLLFSIYFAYKKIKVLFKPGAIFPKTGKKCSFVYDNTPPKKTEMLVWDFLLFLSLNFTSFLLALFLFVHPTLVFVVKNYGIISNLYFILPYFYLQLIHFFRRFYHPLFNYYKNKKKIISYTPDCKDFEQSNKYTHYEKYVFFNNLFHQVGFGSLIYRFLKIFHFIIALFFKISIFMIIFAEFTGKSKESFWVKSIFNINLFIENKIEIIYSLSFYLQTIMFSFIILNFILTFFRLIFSLCDFLTFSVHFNSGKTYIFITNELIYWMEQFYNKSIDIVNKIYAMLYKFLTFITFYQLFFFVLFLIIIYNKFYVISEPNNLSVEMMPFLKNSWFYKRWQTMDQTRKKAIIDYFAANNNNPHTAKFQTPKTQNFEQNISFNNGNNFVIDGNKFANVITFVGFGIASGALYYGVEYISAKQQVVNDASRLAFDKERVKRQIDNDTKRVEIEQFLTKHQIKTFNLSKKQHKLEEKKFLFNKEKQSLKVLKSSKVEANDIDI
jgi:hypothetical protein